MNGHRHGIGYIVQTNSECLKAMFVDGKRKEYLELDEDEK